jgi:hypothetical protein
MASMEGVSVFAQRRQNVTAESRLGLAAVEKHM